MSEQCLEQQQRRQQQQQQQQERQQQPEKENDITEEVIEICMGQMLQNRELCTYIKVIISKYLGTDFWETLVQLVQEISALKSSIPNGDADGDGDDQICAFCLTQEHFIKIEEKLLSVQKMWYDFDQEVLQKI